MECGWEPEQRDLGGLGLAGICRETSRVVRRVILPNFPPFGHRFISMLLFTNALVCSARSTSLLRLVGDWDVLFYLDISCLLIVLQTLLLCTPAYVFCVASLYYTGGGLPAAHSVLNERLPVVPLKRLFFTLHLVAVPFLVIFTSHSLAALLPFEHEIMPPLRLLGWASAAYAAVVCQLACVVSVLEDAALFGAVRRSRELLAGKFWTVATLLLTIDGCIIAMLVACPAILLDDALGLSHGLRLAAAVAMSIALCKVLVIALVAQPVVYMVCKSHRQEVVDLVQLHGST